MPVALFITCVADTLFPEVGPSRRARAGTARPRGRLPGGADVLRPDAPQHRPSRRSAASLPVASSRPFATAEVVVSPSSSCVGTVREYYPRLRARGRRRTPRARGHVSWASASSSCRSSSCGGWASRTSAPRFRIASPTTRPATRCACSKIGDAPLRLLRRRARSRARASCPTPRSAAASAARSRQERGHVAGDAGRQVRQRDRHGRRGLHRRRHLVPAAHRRRAQPARQRRAGRAPGRDPGRRRGGRERAVQLPGGGARASSPNEQLRAQPAQRHAHDPDEASRGRRRARRTGRSCARPAAAIKDDVLGRLDAYLVQFEAAVTAAGGHVHWARDAGEANEIVAGIVRRHGVERGRQGEVAHDGRDRA